jgi:hypothetical protein
MSWKSMKVRNADGRAGVIASDTYHGLPCCGLHIKCGDGSTGYVQLNAEGKDSGDKGWEWLCKNHDQAIGAACWIALGNHNHAETKVCRLTESLSLEATVSHQWANHQGAI